MKGLSSVCKNLSTKLEIPDVTEDYVKTGINREIKAANEKKLEKMIKKVPKIADSWGSNKAKIDHIAEMAIRNARIWLW